MWLLIALVGCLATGGGSAADTATCSYAENSAESDDCCWQDRVTMASVRLIADADAPSAAGGAPELTTITTQAGLDAWWTSTGLTPTGSIAFGGEIGVGFIGHVEPGCQDRQLVGVRIGDAPDTWFAGVQQDSTCEAYDTATCPGPGTPHATLYAVPPGEVSECDFGSFCDG